jgi:hypothetical protein
MPAGAVTLEAEFDVIDVPVAYGIDNDYGYGGKIVGAEGSNCAVRVSVTGYVIDTISVDGKRLDGVRGLTSYTTTTAPKRSIFATFTYTVNFNTPANGSLTVSRESETIESGSIVYAGEVLKITVTPNSGYAFNAAASVFSGLTRDGTTNNYTVTAGRETPPSVTAVFRAITSADTTTPVTPTPPEEPTTVSDSDEGTWEQEDGAWKYIVDGEAATGWIQDDGTWYYLAPDGIMETGWVKDEGAWYYLAPSGAMKTGWVKDKGAWYYLAPNGAMKTGWVKDKNTWYYLNASGKMLTGAQKIGNSIYTFRSNGAWVT